MATVKEVVSAQPFLITLETHRDTVQTVLKKFALHHISSAPVFDGTKFIGFVDLVDILTYVLAVMSKPPGTEDLSVQKLADHFDYLEHYSSFEAVLGDNTTVDSKLLSVQKINDIVDLSHRNPFLATMPEQPLQEVILAFAKGMQRLAICNAHDEITNIITQSSIARWFAGEPHRLGEVGNRTLEELGFAYNDVVMVDINTKALVAFQKIHQSRVNSIAVVNNLDECKLVGNLSASDLKVLLPFFKPPSSSSTDSTSTSASASASSPSESLRFDSLFQPLSVLLPQINKFNGRESSDGVITCRPNSTLLSVVKQLADNHIHRVYCVNENNRPVGSIAINSICEIAILHNYAAIVQ
eukprot:TRINITY_DN12105_c0_g1_i1.p1 TRINITY_DN12105_c0_g1~~TRINITY_DN12105_c0_g1_i1.p1  ORF type:complete len:355 (+),score=71.04 TRINITY_DN12105_c0_g1_i1:118-1182(+)